MAARNSKRVLARLRRQPKLFSIDFLAPVRLPELVLREIGVELGLSPSPETLPLQAVAADRADDRPGAASSRRDQHGRLGHAVGRIHRALRKAGAAPA